MQKKIHRLAFYTLLLAVYGIFFSVESFFNFEGQINAKDIFKYSSFVHFSGNHVHVVKTRPLQSSSAHNIRLNKRFHPEDITPVTVLYIEVPVSHLIPTVIGSYVLIPLPSIAVNHRPLRGPPVVA